ncbi:uncharacterized protein [Maniola hyperantus]|uniref:uncharacterized protein n=1 Tax=Aphantopus hyperantus TaxID=2795564 RepID=UPI0015693A87|nr:uncharacterized protein LOC117988368 [Maniola hyperantus]
MTCPLVILGVFIVFFVIFLRRKDPKPIFGIYSVPGKWYYLKYVVFACLYYYRKYSSKNHAAGKEGRAGQGVKAISNPAEMDKAQPLSYHAKAFDAVFFISAKEEDDKDKGVYVISGCERRPMGMCNGVFYIGLPGHGLLCSKKIPDTVLFGAPIGEFGAEGIKMTPVEPMKKWTISYRGQMWYQNDPSKMVDVDFNGEWNATSKYFDYDCDLHPPAVIRSIAREKWSRQYFEGLKTAHQSHYEQFGVLKCNFKIGNESYEYTLPSFRDHSFGKIRDWSLMHRYAFHHIFLEDGTSISVGVICQPSTATSMEAGAVSLPNGVVLAVEWVDLQLYQHGEGGSAPRDYAFRMQAGDQVYTVQVLVEYESVHYVSSEWEARMVERFCSFNVNGVRGRGVSEFHYRHRDGRPESAAKTDPEWYRTMCHKTRDADP